jgi:hypothetical protein
MSWSTAEVAAYVQQANAQKQKAQALADSEWGRNLRTPLGGLKNKVGQTQADAFQRKVDELESIRDEREHNQPLPQWQEQFIDDYTPTTISFPTQWKRPGQ